MRGRDPRLFVRKGEVVDDAHVEPKRRRDAVEELQRGQEPFGSGSASTNAIVVSITEEGMKVPLGA
jgi:hypothetical protein